MVTTADTSGILQLQTASTAALTIDANQRTAFVAGTAALPAITTDGDTNTGIFFPAADTIAFTEGGAESMRINSSGYVGIGLTSPSAPLNVQAIATNGLAMRVNGRSADNYGELAFWNNANSTNYATVGADQAAMYFGTNASLPVIFTTGGTERMRISSAGVVTAPYQPCFHAYRTTTQTGTNPFTIIFDTAPVNVGSSYSTSTGRFTAPVTGNYFLLFHSIGLASAWSTFLDIILYKNGSSAPLILSNRPASTNGSEVPASLATSSAICNLTAGDYVEIRVLGTSIYSDGNAWLKFMGFLIG